MDRNHIFPFFFVGSMVVLAAAVVVCSVLYARKRTRELAEVAQQIGFSFVGKPWSGPPLSASHKTSLLQKTRGKFSNVMTGSADGFQIGLFDYTYSMGKSTVTQTIASFSQSLQLPPFALRPEGFLDRIGDAIVHNDIDFDSHPEFSRRYHLRSPDEAGTRKLFTPSVLTYLEQVPVDEKWHIEGNATTLMVYRPGRLVKPPDMPSFLNRTSSITRVLFNGGGLKKPGA